MPSFLYTECPLHTKVQRCGDEAVGCNVLALARVIVVVQANADVKKNERMGMNTLTNTQGML
jgi:hypothetical protein